MVWYERFVFGSIEHNCIMSCIFGGRFCRVRLTILFITVICLKIKLVLNSYSNPRINPKKLVALCVPSCLTSLNRVRETIRTACAVSTDVMVYEGIIYPGMREFLDQRKDFDS